MNAMPLEAVKIITVEDLMKIAAHQPKVSDFFVLPEWVKPEQSE